MISKQTGFQIGKLTVSQRATQSLTRRSNSKKSLMPRSKMILMENLTEMPRPRTSCFQKPKKIKMKSWTGSMMPMRMPSLTRMTKGMLKLKATPTTTLKPIAMLIVMPIPTGMPMPIPIETGMSIATRKLMLMPTLIQIQIRKLKQSARPMCLRIVKQTWTRMKMLIPIRIGSWKRKPTGSEAVPAPQP